MTTYTSIHTSPPTCENCGRDKQVTYICDACCSKLNAATRKLRAERDELQRRLDAVVASLKPDGPPIPGGMFDKEVRVLWRAGIGLHTKALAIAEGRTE